MMSRLWKWLRRAYIKRTSTVVNRPRMSEIVIRLTQEHPIHIDRGVVVHTTEVKHVRAEDMHE